MPKGSSKKKIVNGAVVGYGGAFNMGKAHANWMNQAGIPTVAACDLDPARMEAAKKDYPGIRTYTSVEDLLKDDGVDLCVVILPHNMHSKIAVQCAEAGKHVIVEKPMCITVAEADAMIDAAKKNKVMLSVFHNRRHDGDFMTIKDLVERGIIGNVWHVDISGTGWGKPGTWWRSDKKISGGAMYDWGAHFMDWVLNIVPSKVAGVNGYFQKRVWMEATNEDHTQAIVRFENGCVCDIQLGSIDMAPKRRWRILGTKGAIIDGERDGHLTVSVLHEGMRATMQVPYMPTDWQAYYNNIAAHLMDGAELEVKPEEARRVIAIFEAAEKSSKSGKTEKPAYA